MRKSKKVNQIDHEPYEDILRLEKLDPYETLIKPNAFLKKNKKSIK